MASATGTEIQIPFSLNIIGKTIKAIVKNKIVLENEITADTKPLPKAVKQLEAKIEIPNKIKAELYKAKLLTVISNTFFDPPENKCATG